MATHRILVVDDEPDLVSSLESLLEMEIEDVEVVTAEDADTAALALAQKGPFDLIICDQRMPGRQGLEFLEQVREGGGPPAILLTAHREDQKAVAAARTGVIRRFFTKPPDLERFMEGVWEVLDPSRLKAA